MLIDGAAVGGISPLDRGLHYGDGLFETIACPNGRPRFLALHLERLAHGCRVLGFPSPAMQQLREEVERLAAAQERSIVKLIVTRGRATVRGYAVSGREQATRVVIRYPWAVENPVLQQQGVSVRVAAMRLGENPALAGLKHCNRLEQILARSEPGAAAVAESLMLSRSGNLVCGTMTNMFLVDGSPQSPRLRTPAIDQCGVAGVMRRVVLREAARAGIAATECALLPADLAAATEVFLTNARVGVWPVSRVEERALTPGPVTRRIQSLLRPLLEDPANG
ncbi:MAG TPA: aminodeoxychorismate lyase [Steroidobacteraceae bacterium]|jgi:4-amino-4-deoxychorismate lyase|nr:aminodeoxychorismate lyase [Steroidobacteraceae bacterium]